MTRSKVSFIIVVLGMLSLFVAVSHVLDSVAASIDVSRESTKQTLASVAAGTAHYNNILANLDGITKTLNDPRTGVARTLRNINLMTAQIARTSTVAHSAAVAEEQQIRVTGVKLGTMLDSGNRIMVDTDTNLYGTNGTMVELQQTLGELKAMTGKLSTGSDDLLRSASVSVKAIGDLASDPNLRVVALNMAQASGQTSEATVHVNHAMAEFDESLGYVRDSLKPQKVPFWRGVMSLAVGQALGLPLRYLPQRVQVVNPPAQTKETK